MEQKAKSFEQKVTKETKGRREEFEARIGLFFASLRYLCFLLFKIRDMSESNAPQILKNNFRRYIQRRISQ